MRASASRRGRNGPPGPPRWALHARGVLPRSAAGSLGGTGKLGPSELARAVLRFTGARRSDVLVGPSPGIDVGVVRLSPARVLLVTTDPLYLEPGLGWEDAAWFGFHILASDLATSGHPPTHAAVDLNWPAGTPERVIATVMRVLAREARSLGAAIVTGHTGRYGTSTFPLIGGATLLGFAPTSSYVTAAMGRAGDRLLLSKSPGIETAVLLARLAPEQVEGAIGGAERRALARRFHDLTTVPDARLAASVGLRGEGVHAMHDATEGGTLRALQELVRASDLGADLDLSQVPRDPGVEAACRRFGADPLGASSEGTLVVACSPAAAPEVLRRWRRAGLDGTDVGSLVARGNGFRDRGRALRDLPPDRFSDALAQARRP